MFANPSSVLKNASLPGVITSPGWAEPTGGAATSPLVPNAQVGRAVQHPLVASVLLFLALTRTSSELVFDWPPSATVKLAASTRAHVAVPPPSGVQLTLSRSKLVPDWLAALPETPPVIPRRPKNAARATAVGITIRTHSGILLPNNLTVRFIISPI